MVLLLAGDQDNKPLEASTTVLPVEERRSSDATQQDEVKEVVNGKGCYSQEGGSTQTETAFLRSTADNAGVLPFKSESKAKPSLTAGLTPRKRQFEPGTVLKA